MKKSQEIQLKISAAKEKGLRLPATATAEESAAVATELADLEAEHRAALQSEYAEIAAVPAGAGETAELRAMLNRGNVGNIFDHVLNNRPMAGPEAEIQAHYGVGGNSVPLAMLAGSHGNAEERAAATLTGGVAGGDGGYAGPLFGDSLVVFANGRIDQIPAGVASWPVLAAAPTTATHSDSTEVAETTGAVVVSTLDPHESRASFAVRRVDTLRFPTLGDGLRETLRLAVMDQLDREMLVRAAAGLLTAAIGVNPATPTATSTFAQFLAAAYGAVDGVHARNIADIRMIVKATSYATMGAATVGNSDVSAAEKLGAISGGVRVSQHNTSAANYDDAIVIKAGGGGSMPSLVAGVWPSIDIIEDNVTRAAFGEIRLHGVYLSDFAILRAAGYNRARFRN